VEEFERAFSGFLGARHAVAVANGTLGLVLALRSFDIGPGDEVIVPDLTWPSTALAVLECGARPVLIDVDPRSYCMDVRNLEARLGPRTRAVIPVHLYSSAVDMERLLAICRPRGIVVIEDAAQCHGAAWGERRLGTLGDAGVFSFHEKKLLPGGEGGCVVTDDDKTWTRLHELRDHGLRAPAYGRSESPLTGTNARMPAVIASLLLARLARLPCLLEQEAHAAAFLTEALKDLEEFRPQMRLASITLQTHYSSCWRLVGLDRASFRRYALAETGICWSVPYPPLSLDFEGFCAGHPMGRQLLPILEAPLPISVLAHTHEGLRFHHSVLLASESQIARFADGIRKVVQSLSSRRSARRR